MEHEAVMLVQEVHEQRRRTTAVQFLSQSIGAAHLRAAESGAGRGACVVVGASNVHPADRSAALAALKAAQAAAAAHEGGVPGASGRPQARMHILVPGSEGQEMLPAALQQPAQPPRGRRAFRHARPRSEAVPEGFSPLRDTDMAAPTGRARAAAIAPSDPSAPPLPPPPGWVRVSGGEGEELEPTLAEEDLLGEEAAEEVDEEEWV